MSQTPGIPSSGLIVPEADAKKRLQSICQLPSVAELHQALGKEAELHLVGGTVRDVFLGKENTDIDIACKLEPEKVQNLLEKTKLKVIETGIQHGTLTIPHKNQNIEITTFRKPGPRDVAAYSSTIEEDLSGRDFTINAIAFSFDSGKVLDPFNGQEDLKAEKVRCVGSAEDRFQEDPLRLLRLIRFGPAAGREIEQSTLSAASSAVTQIESCSPERIRDELVKILVSPQPAAALRLLQSSGLLKIILPELEGAVGFEQNDFHIHDVFEHTLWVLERSEPSELQRLSSLFHDIAKPETFSVDDQGRRHFYRHEVVGEAMARRVLKRLRFSKKTIKDVTTLVRLHMRPLDCGPAGVRRLLRDLGDLFGEWLKLKVADAPPLMEEAEFENNLEQFRAMVEEERNRDSTSPYSQLAINGDDLLELGMAPGPAVGDLLQRLHELVLDDPQLNNQSQLLEKARRIMKEEQLFGHP